MNFSARSYFLAGIIVLLGVFSQWSDRAGADLWQVPLAALLVALLLEGIAAHRSPPKLERRLPSRAYLGQPLQGELALFNPGRRTLDLESVDDFPESLDGTRDPLRWRVTSGAESRQTISLVPQELGRLRWSDLYTRRLGQFGLAWWPHKLDIPNELEVVPDHLHGHERGGGTSMQGDLAKPTAGSGSELIGLRDYQPGDPLRAMDWKATARRDRQTVRIYSQEGHMELILAVGTGRTSSLQAGELTRLHHYANVAARLAERAILRGDRVGLVVFAEKPVEVLGQQRGAAGLRQIRKGLERMRSLPRESNPLPALMRIRSLARQRSLVVLLTEIEEGEAANQLVKGTRLLTPKHLPLIAGLVDDDVLALRDRPATNWLAPYETLAAWETDQAMRRSRLKLQSLGAQVILARAADLDRTVLRHYETLRAMRKV